MLPLIKFLKPFRSLILMIFLLLFVQAMSDLALPNFLSRMVNVGIQQQGLENALPEAIRPEVMQKIGLFVKERDRVVIEKNYLLSDVTKHGREEYESLRKKFPLLGRESLYILQPGGKEEMEELGAMLLPPLMLVSAVAKDGLSVFPSDMVDARERDAFSYLQRLPQEKREALMIAFLEKASLVPRGMFFQTAIRFVLSEYKIIGLDTEGMQTVYMAYVGGLMVLFSLLGAACSLTVGYLSARVAAGFARDTRRRLFFQVEQFSNIEFDRFTTSSLITRTTNDIEQIQMFLMMLLRIAFYAPMMGAGSILMVLRQDVSMLWIIALGVLSIIAMISVGFTVATPRFKKMQKLIDRLNLLTREILTGLMVIRAFNSQRYQEAKFDEANKDLTRTTLYLNGMMMALMPAMMLIMNGVMLTILWTGAHRVDLGAIQVGSLMAFMQYAMHVIMSFLMVSVTFLMMPRSSVAAQRIAEVIETQPAVKDPESPRPFVPGQKGRIEFQDVSFKYQGADDYVLREISFQACPGETIAFIGGTGSGKSTLINLIPRFYDVTEGRILIDGVDVREVTQHDLRQKIGYVPQKSMLFSGTVESNIRFGREDIAEDIALKATRTSQSMEFIERNEKGLQYEIAQGGANLSGGQRQRLSIARALARKPEIYIFDDSFSALDFKTDAALRKALHEETRDATVMIVGQRISTIRNADRIVVIHQGRIAGIGRHRALLQECEVYREIALSQLSAEELER